MSEIIRTEDLTKHYVLGGETVRAVRSVERDFVNESSEHVHASAGAPGIPGE